MCLESLRVESAPPALTETARDSQSVLASVSDPYRLPLAAEVRAPLRLGPWLVERMQETSTMFQADLHLAVMSAGTVDTFGDVRRCRSGFLKFVNAILCIHLSRYKRCLTKPCRRPRLVSRLSCRSTYSRDPRAIPFRPRLISFRHNGDDSSCRN